MSTSTPTLSTADTPVVPAAEPSIPVIKPREGAITKVTGDRLTGPNWVTWQVRMMSLLALCEVEPYVRGEIKQPKKKKRKKIGLGTTIGRKTITTSNILSCRM
jgi:hypothetical protein